MGTAGKEGLQREAVLDPVCGMTIDPADAVGHIEYNGQTYYFCNESCLQRFSADPASFLESPRAATAVSRSGTGDAEYTCPMDPEVRQRGPGACPKCGMALEPVIAAPVTKDPQTR